MRDMQQRPVSAETLAAWVEASPDTAWFVEGHQRMEELVFFPCRGAELGRVLRQLQPRVKILVTRGGGDSEHEVTLDEIDNLTERYDDDRELMLVEHDANGRTINWTISEERSAVPLLAGYEASRRAG